MDCLRRRSRQAAPPAETQVSRRSNGENPHQSHPGMDGENKQRLVDKKEKQWREGGGGRQMENMQR